MSELIRVAEKYYILASSALADGRTRVLKHNETFAVFDSYGDIKPVGRTAQGLFHEGTRFLSQSVLKLESQSPLLLSSTVLENNTVLTVDLTNPDVYVGEELHIPHGTLHIARSGFLWEGSYYQRLRLTNYGSSAIETGLTVQFESDFVDIFELRGTERERRGEYGEPVVRGDSVVLRYRGLDGVSRSAHILCSPTPAALSKSEVRFDVKLDPEEQDDLYLTVSCENGDGRVSQSSYASTRQKASRNLAAEVARECEVSTSNEHFNSWLQRSMADLRMMITETPMGPYPYAGVPWYSTPFGRDGIITALETLWVKPDLAKGVLRYLASTQAAEVDQGHDAEPGKIVHEQRKGEMPALGEVPFGSYYGTVDATPLFVLLAGAYYERSGDLQFAEELWPHIERALEWIDSSGDLDGDGFVEYQRHSPEGLINQGWKDSHDAIFHADGSLAEGPTALCEVQGYVFAAKRKAALLARALKKPKLARVLASEAADLRKKFVSSFWCERLSTYVLALDGRKGQCRVRSSNAGQSLFTGIATAEHAQRVAEGLFSEAFFSGWGIRTIAAGEARYNPISYHNGSVWPHDNALIGWGLAQYGRNDLAVRILEGLFDASVFVDLCRLPELMCGFARRPGKGPTLYPVACAPQAWSAASVFMLLQAALGLTVDASRVQIRFVRPVLPPFLERVEIDGLEVGPYAADVVLHRHPNDVGIQVKRRDGPVDVVCIK
ncbi:MAG: glycogen debranching N-terminal domain-containing protein [Candidatus Binatia bacterium]